MMAQQVTHESFRVGHTTAGDVGIGIETPNGIVPFIVLTPEQAVAWADMLMREADSAVHASRAARRG